MQPFTLSISSGREGPGRLQEAKCNVPFPSQLLVQVSVHPRLRHDPPCTNYAINMLHLLYTHENQRFSQGQNPNQVDKATNHVSLVRNTHRKITQRTCMCFLGNFLVFILIFFLSWKALVLRPCDVSFGPFFLNHIAFFLQGTHTLDFLLCCFSNKSSSSTISCTALEL